MPEFAEMVNYIWDYLKCRRSEGFSPDLLWNIAYPFVADEFFEVTNEWLDRLLEECVTAANGIGKEKCTKRCAVINRRVQKLYENHNWLYASCRREWDCCEEERTLAAKEGREFRLELFPMEQERLKQVAAKKAKEDKAAQIRQEAEERIDYKNKVLSFAETKKYLQRSLSRGSFEKWGYLPTAGRLCDEAVREFYGERLPKKYLEFLQTDGSNQTAGIRRQLVTSLRTSRIFRRS